MRVIFYSILEVQLASGQARGKIVVQI